MFACFLGYIAIYIKLLIKVTRIKDTKGVRLAISSVKDYFDGLTYHFYYFERFQSNFEDSTYIKLIEQQTASFSCPISIVIEQVSLQEIFSRINKYSEDIGFTQTTAKK
jgi:hypothetical protein